MTKTILLFDMDGVLIQSHGYYMSLQFAIKIIGQRLGIENAQLDKDEISKLEALGVYQIWDHLAFFSSMLLMYVWSVNPDIEFSQIATPAQEGNIPIPDINFKDLTIALSSDIPATSLSISDYIIAQGNHLKPDQRRLIELIIHSRREIKRSPVLPILQELILGSQLFSEVYGITSQFNLQSYPETHDQPYLSVERINHLKKWLKDSDHHAAIITNRPNFSSPDGLYRTPEAEIGAKLIGLEDMPLIGAGSLERLANENDIRKPLNKPHPVHVLAGMQAALGRSFEQSLIISLNLINLKETSTSGFSSMLSHWQELNKANVIVFEDSTAGLTSAVKAVEILESYGISINLDLMGISPQPDKREALQKFTDQIFSDINSCPLIDIISG